tara:strand:- start:7230 stop:7685 length:456 start_codon:yes stop_codon:yes gene_type:complete
LIGIGFEHPGILEGLFQAIFEEANFRNNWIVGFEQCKTRAIAPIVIVSVFEEQKVPQLKQLTAQATGKWPVVAQRLANRIDKTRAAPPAKQHCGMAEGYIVDLEIRPERVFASLAFGVFGVGNDFAVVHVASCWKKLPGFVLAVRVLGRFM